jgi:hypothetical protein
LVRPRVFDAHRGRGIGARERGERLVDRALGAAVVAGRGLVELREREQPGGDAGARVRRELVVAVEDQAEHGADVVLADRVGRSILDPREGDGRRAGSFANGALEFVCACLVELREVLPRDQRDEGALRARVGPIAALKVRDAGRVRDAVAGAAGFAVGRAVVVVVREPRASGVVDADDRQIHERSEVVPRLQPRDERVKSGQRRVVDGLDRVDGAAVAVERGCVAERAGELQDRATRPAAGAHGVERCAVDVERAVPSRPAAAAVGRALDAKLSAAVIERKGGAASRAANVDHRRRGEGRAPPRSEHGGGVLLGRLVAVHERRSRCALAKRARESPGPPSVALFEQGHQRRDRARVRHGLERDAVAVEVQLSRALQRIEDRAGVRAIADEPDGDRRGPVRRQSSGELACQGGSPLGRGLA